MINLHSPFKPWESEYGKHHLFGLGEAVSAAAYVASNIFSWSEAKKMPEKQAKANKIVLDKQKADYDAISKKQRDILRSAIQEYLQDVNHLLELPADDPKSFQEAFDSVPRAALYVPVDPCCEQANTIECNIGKTVRSNDYVRYVNRLHEQNDLIHALSLDPRFLVTLDIQSKSIQDMTRGLLSVGDVVEVMTDNAEQASLVGRIGNTKKTTARDLGISKIRVQAAGRKEFRETTAWANSAVSPLSRQHDITEMMLTPQQRIDLALHQAQLIQQSLQNKNNALAKAAPFKLAKLQTRLQRDIAELQSRSTRALLVNTHVPNYAATVVPNTSNISGLVGSIGQAVSNANLSHFFGGPPSDQTGYRGASNNSTAPSYTPVNYDK